MKKILAIKPTEMTKEVMVDLEKRGMIIRLCPHNHDLDPKPGETLDGVIYASKDCTGPHKLITVTVNRTEFAKFGVHQDNEEFLLIGDPDTKPMYLAFSYLDNDALHEKIRNETLVEDDFIMLKIKYNDPEVSFFVVLEGVCHGEAIVESDKPVPSFYVTEGRDIETLVTDWGNYRLAVKA